MTFVTEPGAVATGSEIQLMRHMIALVKCRHPVATAPGSVLNLGVVAWPLHEEENNPQERKDGRPVDDRDEKERMIRSPHHFFSGGFLDVDFALFTRQRSPNHSDQQGSDPERKQLGPAVLCVVSIALKDRCHHELRHKEADDGEAWYNETKSAPDYHSNLR